MDKRFGGNAPPVEAGAAERAALFDDDGGKADLRRPYRGDIAARPGADDEKVEMFHDLLLQRFERRHHNRIAVERNRKRGHRQGFLSANSGLR